MEGVPDFAIYDPGADSALNGSRRQAVLVVTEHTTQGTDSRGLGKSRHHSTPGTFNFLNRDEGIYCYYPAFVRTSHAAGANHKGPGVENEGFTGQPLTPNQVANLARLADWFLAVYQVPTTLYDGPRIAIDGGTYRGHVNHNSVATTPALAHTDRIPPNEWTASGTPSPSTSGDDMKGWIAAIPKGDGKQWLIDGLTRVHIASPAVKQTILEIDELRGHSLLVDHEIHNVNQAFLDACVELKD